MKNLTELMKQAGDMQTKMADMQSALEDMEVEGLSGAGLVKVVLNGKGVLLAVHVDESLVKPGEKEVMEDLIVAAHNDAKAKAEAMVAEKTQEMMGGISLPPGMKMPF
jgi:DNA-binding YbaB/EbfC family protein